jgi:twitching motility protein PilT
LLNNNAVENLIREGRTAEIDVVIETGGEEGMVTLNASLADLVRKGEITADNAYRYSLDTRGLERLL